MKQVYSNNKVERRSDAVFYARDDCNEYKLKQYTKPQADFVYTPEEATSENQYLNAEHVMEAQEITEWSSQLSVQVCDAFLTKASAAGAIQLDAESIRLINLPGITTETKLKIGQWLALALPHDKFNPRMPLLRQQENGRKAQLYTASKKEPIVISDKDLLDEISDFGDEERAKKYNPDKEYVPLEKIDVDLMSTKKFAKLLNGIKREGTAATAAEVGRDWDYRMKAAKAFWDTANAVEYQQQEDVLKDSHEQAEKLYYILGGIELALEFDEPFWLQENWKAWRRRKGALTVSRVLAWAIRWAPIVEKKIKEEIGLRDNPGGKRKRDPAALTRRQIFINSLEALHPVLLFYATEGSFQNPWRRADWDPKPFGKKTKELPYGIATPWRKERPVTPDGKSDSSGSEGSPSAQALARKEQRKKNQKSTEDAVQYTPYKNFINRGPPGAPKKAGQGIPDAVLDTPSKKGP